MCARVCRRVRKLHSCRRPLYKEEEEEEEEEATRARARARARVTSAFSMEGRSKALWEKREKDKLEDRSR